MRARPGRRRRGQATAVHPKLLFPYRMSRLGRGNVASRPARPEPSGPSPRRWTLLCLYGYIVTHMEPMPHPFPAPLIDLIAARFRVIGEPMRIKLLDRLRAGPATVQELTDATARPQPNVSKHLGVLHSAGIVAREKDGLHVRYSIADESVFALCEQVCGGLRRPARRARRDAPGHARRMTLTAKQIDQAGPIGRLGGWTATHFRAVVTAWVLLAVGLGALAPQVEHALSGAGWEASGSESVRAREQIDRQLRGPGQLRASGRRQLRAPHGGDPLRRTSPRRAAARQRRRVGRGDRAARGGGLVARRRTAIVWRARPRRRTRWCVLPTTSRELARPPRRRDRART